MTPSIIKLPFKIRNFSVVANSWHSKTLEIISINADIVNYENLEFTACSTTRETVSGYFMVLGELI